MLVPFRMPVGEEWCQALIGHVRIRGSWGGNPASDPAPALSLPPERGSGCRAKPRADTVPSGHFGVTALLADPPRLLLTVMFCGLLGQENWPPYLPPPLFVSVPIN